MPDHQVEYRLFDENPPVIDEVPFPDGAPDGELIQGVAYTLVPVLSGLDDVTAENPAVDLDRVEYFLDDPDVPGNPGPSYSAVSPPFSYSFIGAYSGDGVTPRPFPVWVRAVDTSTNRSEVVEVTMEVQPNAAPAVAAVTAEALQPVAGTFYAGSAIRASVSGIDDVDGSQLTVSVELRQDGEPLAIAADPGRLVLRPGAGWGILEPQTFDFEIPIDRAEGAPLYFRARVVDSQGAEATVESDRFPVADDALEPAVEAVITRRADGGADTSFFIGESLYFEARSRDLETALETVEITIDRDDIFPSPLPATRVPGSAELYRIAIVTVPVDVFTEATPVAVTASATDFGGNVGARTATIEVAPEPDEWLTPWQSGAWPAGNTSVISPGDGTALVLRAQVADTNDDGAGNPVPGTIVDVMFKGPVETGGAIKFAADWTSATLQPSTGEP